MRQISPIRARLHVLPRVTLAAVALAPSACNTRQSALAPFGEDAANILSMTIAMSVAAVIIFASVLLLSRHAIRAREGQLTLKSGMRMVLILGAIVPTIVLGALLFLTLPAMRPRPAASTDLRISVTGEQFWWRVRYRPAGLAAVTSANEVRVPVGRTVVFEVTARDVLHSFWIPGLGGKMDMIPGRTNTLVVRATRAGRFRGQCAEFCGLSHALMAFEVVAMEPNAFDAWLARERTPARAVADAAGAQAFAANGCGGCHAIRGTGHAGAIGPDLSRFGARGTLAAGVLPMTRANVSAFIRDPHAAKPGVRMPAYPQIAATEADRIARYLEGLR